MKQYCVYIMSNIHRTIYTGVTSDLVRRAFQHQEGSIPGFTAKYGLKRPVYFEVTSDVRSAIAREKQIKGWSRAKKVALIESANPNWADLGLDWSDEAKAGATDSSLRSE